jgi:hypothetical protein
MHEEFVGLHDGDAEDRYDPKAAFGALAVMNWPRER